MSGYTEAKIFGVAANETVGTDPCPAAALTTWRVPAGVYNFTWGVGNQILTLILPCSTCALVFEAGKPGSIDILLDNVQVTCAIDTLVQLRPESYETLLSANSMNHQVFEVISNGRARTAINRTSGVLGASGQQFAP